MTFCHLKGKLFEIKPVMILSFFSVNTVPAHCPRPRKRQDRKNMLSVCTNSMLSDI